MAKRRANGEGNIRKRKDGRWEGRYSAGYDPSTGKRITKNVLGKSQAEVKEKLKVALQEAEALDLTRADGCTVEEWVNTWFETYSKPNIRPSTADYYRRFIDCHIIPALGDIKLKNLTARHIQTLYNDMKDHGRVREAQKSKTPGLSNAYIRGLHTMFHNCLNRAVKERLILRNPSEDCIVPKLQKKEMKILQPDHVSSYLKAADVVRLKADRGAGRTATDYPPRNGDLHSTDICLTGDDRPASPGTQEASRQSLHVSLTKNRGDVPP